MPAKKEEEVKISVEWYFIWIALIGMLTLFSVLMIWYGLKKGNVEDTNSLFKVIAGVMGIGIAIKTSMDLVKAIRGIKGPKWRYMTLVKCVKCNFKSEREFKEGEYVGKKWDKPCPACGAPMIIESIYAKPPEERRSLV